MLNSYFGLIYVGSDDGWIHVTKDGGNNWERISDDLPQDMWVSRVEPSRHDEATIYTSLNGYRWDDFNAYIYMSTDYGKTWTKIGKDLPAEPVNVIREDPKNPNILYVGTDHGLYVSLDKGQSFMAMTNNLPAVAVHDLIVHPRDNDLVVGTHGRLIYIGNVEHLQQLSSDMTAKDVHVFKLNKIKHNSRWGSSRNAWSKPYTPNATIPFYSNSAGKAAIEVRTDDDLLVKTMEVDAVKGLNYVDYDLTIEQLFKKYPKGYDEDKKLKFKKADDGKIYIEPRKYKITVSIGGNSATETLTVLDKKR